MDNLDSDLLRTFLAVAQTGSVTDGAARIHRSQSATSVQLKRLEAILGHPVFVRHGRGVVLSDIGKRLLPVAREVTARLDTTQQALAGTKLLGKIRLGIPDDRGRDKLARIFAEFARLHPEIELEVTCALSAAFPEAIDKEQLDLAIYEVETLSPGEELLTEEPTCWIAANGHDFADRSHLPVALFDQACWWRDAAIRSLEVAAKPYRTVYSSQSVAGVLAAVEAGIAVGLLARSSLHSNLHDITSELGVGATPNSKLVLAASRNGDSVAVETMKSELRKAFQAGFQDTTRFRQRLP